MIYLCGRRVKVQTGGKTQTVNICTEENKFGLYDYRIRMSWPQFVSEQILQDQKFAMLEDVVAFLTTNYHGVVEQSPSGGSSPRLGTNLNPGLPLRRGVTQQGARTRKSSVATIGAIYVPTGDAEDWRSLLADPENHWRTGYSAKTLAYCWQDSSGFPAEITQLLGTSGIPSFTQIDFLLAFPEYQVALPGGSRPSQNDLFVLAKGFDRELITMMVEGKVSEPFGRRLDEWLSADNSESVGKRERLNYLTEILGLTSSLPGGIRYQLLHRTASAVIEAIRFNAKHAVMIVHSFSLDNRSFDDFSAFVKLYGASPSMGKLIHLRKTQGVELYVGWANGNAKYLRY